MSENVYGPVSLIAILRDTVLRDPKSTIAIDAGPDKTSTVSREQFWSRTWTLRAELASRGVGPGSCVAVWLPNWSDALVWQFAVASLGAHVIGVNTRYNVDEVAHVLNYARPSVLAIAHDFVGLDLNGRLRQAVKLSEADAPSVAVVCGPHGSKPGELALQAYDVGRGAWVPQQPESTFEIAGQDVPDYPDALAVAFTTSGSTGKPKLAAHSSRAVAEHAQACTRSGGWKPGDVTLCALPLSGVFSFVPAMTAIASGGACLLEPVFNADKIVADMSQHGVTHVIAADDVVGRLADAWKASPVKLERWRRLLIADFNGKSVELSGWAEQQFGLKASGVYGSSELFALTAFWPDTVPSPRRWKGGGLLVSNRIEVRCSDSDTSQVAAAGATGELQFRGPNVVDGYLGAPELREQQFTADGWFRSGDLGILHEEGCFEYICRAGDALRLKGFLVEPAEIEARLAAHGAIGMAKVVGIKLGDGSTEAVAFVVLNPEAAATPEDLRAWCTEGLARHKVPRTIHIIDEMPATSGVNGIKVKTAELRLWAQQRDEIGARHA